MSRIQRVELSLFRFEVDGLDLPAHGAAGVGNVIARKGSRLPAQRWAVRVETDDGARGEYVTHWVGTPSSFAQALMLAPHLPGRDPDQREGIWQDLRREVRAYDHMGHGPLDIAFGTWRAGAVMSPWHAGSAASARGCPPTRAATTARMRAVGSTAPQPLPPTRVPAASMASPASRSTDGTMVTCDGRRK